MIPQKSIFKRFKQEQLTLSKVSFFLLTFMFLACSVNKKLQSDELKDDAINQVFTNDEIKELTKLQLLIDKEVLAKTGITDKNLAYKEYFRPMAKFRYSSDSTAYINLPFDSLVQEISSNPTYLELWNIDTLPNGNFHLHLNIQGKVMPFISNLSSENPVYSQVQENIEIMGDISPATVGSFILETDKYFANNSEGERLFASILLPILCNKQVMKSPLKVKNKSDYSSQFLDGFNNMPPEYKTFYLDSNKLVINDEYDEYFPDYIPIGVEIVMQGENSQKLVELIFMRINQSTINYHFEIQEKNRSEVISASGQAHMLATFFFGSESDLDERSGETYFSEQFIDDKTGNSIRIGKDDFGDLRAKIVGPKLALKDCPVLIQ